MLTMQLIVAIDKRTGMLPIEMATANRHSKEIVYNLLKHDMPIDMKEKGGAKLIPHKHSWTHLVSLTNDSYHDVVNTVLQQCSQPQIIALSQIENQYGEVALFTATPLCKHAFRVSFRLFHTLEMVDPIVSIALNYRIISNHFSYHFSDTSSWYFSTQPAYINDENGVQIFYALRYAPPPEKMGYFTTLYRDDKQKYNHVEPWDDLPTDKDQYEDELDLSNLDIEEKLELIKNETGKRVIAKLTSRTDIVSAEMCKREEHQLSRHYVPAIISVHHTIQHAAYSEAMAEPSYCITMEGTETTAENLLLDLRRSGDVFSKEHLKSIAISLLHIHDHGLVHGDFGTHNVAKFGNRWKILGIGGSIEIGHKTNPERGFFLPPEAVVLETRNVSLGEKNVGAQLVSVAAKPSYDIWAFGTIIYEALAGLPLSPYRSAYKAKRAMTTAELFKVGQWDNRSLRKALRHVNDDNAQDLIKTLLHPDPESRVQSMREVLEHPYFGIKQVAGNSVFAKSLSAKRAENATLKIYSDEFMIKMGWTDADVSDMFMPPEIPLLEDDMEAVEEGRKDVSLDSADVNKIEFQEEPSENNIAEVAGQQASSCDDFVSFQEKEENVGTMERNSADESQMLASTSQTTPARYLPDCEHTNTAVPKTQPQSTSPPPPVSMSTPKTEMLSSTKSKSRFSVKGLKSKFGKK